ncbi:MAG: OmpA family protein [Deltaproteobacteria bacterium]
MRNRLLLSSVVLATVACATAPSPSLVDARRIYERADAEALPGTTELYEAKYALERAETAHARAPGSDEALHAAYIAERRAERAATIVERDRVAAIHARTLRQYGRERARVARFVDLSPHDQEEDVREKLEVLERAVGLPDAKTMRLEATVEFDSGTARLDDPVRAQLSQLARTLVERAPRHAIVVVGHTDAEGSQATNERLSRDRAEAVKDALVAFGVAPQSVDVIARGDDAPIASNASVEGRERNRRVKIVIAALAE